MTLLPACMAWYAASSHRTVSYTQICPWAFEDIFSQGCSMWHSGRTNTFAVGSDVVCPSIGSYKPAVFLAVLSFRSVSDRSTPIEGEVKYEGYRL